MTRVKLDQGLLERVAEKTGRKKPSLQSSVSQLASKYAIASEAALVLLAKQHDIGAAHYLKRLPADVQAQVRETLPALFEAPTSSRTSATRRRAKTTKASKRQKTTVSLATEYLIHDSELRARVADLLKATGKFDRVIREATTVLDHRVKSLSGLKGTPQSVIPRAINPDPTKAVIELADEPSQQEGFFSVYKGLFLAFRNAAHHELTDKLTREDALKFCGFVDLLLLTLSEARIHRERARV